MEHNIRFEVFRTLTKTETVFSGLCGNYTSAIPFNIKSIKTFRWLIICFRLIL